VTVDIVAGESSLLYINLYGIYIIILWLSSEKYEIMCWKKNKFKDLKDFLIFFNWWRQLMYTMYFSLLYYMVWLLKKLDKKFF
jgi:hypothetical protein